MAEVNPSSWSYPTSFKELYTYVNIYDTNIHIFLVLMWAPVFFNVVSVLLLQYHSNITPVSLQYHSSITLISLKYHSSITLVSLEKPIFWFALDFADRAPDEISDKVVWIS